MSHIVQIQTEISDPAGIRAACDRLRLPEPVFGETKLFSDSKTGWAVQLRDWRFPIICDTTSGRVDFDNFSGRWGDRKELDGFIQRYAVEKARIEARKRGHMVTEQQLDDGSIRLMVQIGGAE